MALYKLQRDWKHFSAGQIIDISAPSALEAMKGDADGPIGVPYVEEKKVVTETERETRGRTSKSKRSSRKRVSRKTKAGSPPATKRRS